MTEREIFLEALEMTTPEALAAYLQRTCGEDATLRRKVEELLKEHFSDDSLLAGPAMDGGRATIKLEFALEAAPAQMVGRYKLLEKIGEGGFGEVWMAEQREPVKRRVALKIIKPGMDSRQVVARFEAERQALAMMDHANIAKILDAGTTDSGRPYFVMELVRGIKITEYCDQQKLDTHQRLELFILVCHAIQHAHQKGIIHRDIKPSNILVTLHDGVPVPKVIDFGIAKATQQELTDKTLFTQFQQFIGTPAYISPEQAEMSGLDIDTRADIYSLGVLLYELLVGQTPFDPKEIMQGGLDALRQIIREKEPPRPSTKLNTLQGDARTTAGKCRQTDVGKLVHQLQGDLDWIVMKCLEKDRARRYETANGLAMDIQRHLANEPVLARPPSRLYEFQKTVRRHKVGFAAAGAVVLALAVGLGIATWTLVKEKAARERAVAAEQEQARLRQIAEANEKKAETAAASSAQVAQFMKDMLSGVGPSVAKGRDTAMLKEILDKTAERVGRDLKNQPQVEAELRGTLGATYIELGEFVAAETMAREALRIRRSILEKSDPLVRGSMAQLASALAKRNQSSNDLAEAEALVRMALKSYSDTKGEVGTNIVGWVALHAGILNLQKRFPEAESASRKALAMRRELLGPEHQDVASSLDNLALVLRDSGKLDEAEQLLREALAMQRKLLGDVSLDTATSLQYLGGILERRKKPPEAEAAYREALAVRRKIYGTDNVYTAVLLTDIGGTLQAQSKYAEATSVYRELIAVQKKMYGETHRNVLNALEKLGGMLAAEGKHAEATSLFRELVAARKKMDGETHRNVEIALRYLAGSLGAQGELTEAIDVWREEVAVERRITGNEQPWLSNSLWDLARALTKAGRLDEAEQAFRESLEIRRKSLGNDDSFTIDAAVWLGLIQRSLDKKGEAVAFLREKLDHAQAAGDTNSWLGVVLHHFAENLSNQKKFNKARQPAEEAWALYQKHPGWPEHERAHAYRVLEQVLTGLNDQAALDALDSLQRDELARMRGKLSAEDPNLAGFLANSAWSLLTRKKFAEAEAPARESLAIREKAAPDDWLTFNTHSLLGGILLGQKKYAEAESFLLSGYEGMKQREKSIPAAAKMRITEAIQRVAELYEATGQPEKVAEWKKLLEPDQAKAEK